MVARRRLIGLAGDPDHVARAERDGAFGHGGADLGAFRVDQDADAVRDGPYVVDNLRQALLGEMGRVQADDVHPRLIERFNKLHFTSLIRNGRDNLRMFKHIF